MDNGEETSGEHKMVVSGKELVNLNPGNNHANKNVLHLERASALDNFVGIYFQFSLCTVPLTNISQ